MKKENKPISKLSQLYLYFYEINNPTLTLYIQGFMQQFWGKAPGQNWENMIDLTSKLG